LAELPPDIAHAVASATGFVFDLDGTLALGDAVAGGHCPLPHALELLHAVKARGTPLRLFTNGSGKTPRAYAASLRAAGFPIDDDEMMTPATSAAAWFASKGVRKVRVLGGEGMAAPLREAGVEPVGPSEKARGVDAVFTGWHRDFAFADLEAACEDIWSGAMLTTASHVRFFATAAGRSIGASFAINSMITAMTGKRATVLGKPSRVALDTAVRAMGLTRAEQARVVVVGDAPALEMRMARTGGATGIAMTTGMLTREAAAALPAAERPHAVLDSLEPLLRALG
jgi:NagD protein